MGRRRSFGASLAAMARANERAARIRNKELQRAQVARERLDAKRQAINEVIAYNNSLNNLTSVHKVASPGFNWAEVLGSPEPQAPLKKAEAEAEAQKHLDGYSPGFWDRLFKREQKVRSRLQAKLEEAKARDEDCFRVQTAKYQEERQNWASLRELAEQVLALDSEAIAEALDEFRPGETIEELGAEIEFSVADDGCHVQATISFDPEDVIPTDVKTLLASGKPSVKKLPQSRFGELLQTFVCGSALRIARDVFALIPVDTIFVHVIINILNPATGKRENQPALSVAINRDKLLSLNFVAVEPPESMTNFVHRMDFTKSRGFSAVELIEPSSFVDSVTHKRGRRS